MPKGLFIVIEGLDGSGKSTQATLLFEWLKKHGYNPLLTHEPTYEKIGSLLREFYLKKVDLPKVDALLFAADREEHVKTVILPALEQGKTVISDRYYYSSVAYQTAQGLELRWLLELNKFFPRPDLTIIIDTMPEECIKRVEKAKPEKVKFENVEFLRKVRKNYLEFPEILKEKIVIINGDREVEKVFEDVLKEVKKVIK
jgi:dTMP kinase